MGQIGRMYLNCSCSSLAEKTKMQIIVWPFLLHDLSQLVKEPMCAYKDSY